jgi:hypothetical protein
MLVANQQPQEIKNVLKETILLSKANEELLLSQFE